MSLFREKLLVLVLALVVVGGVTAWVVLKPSGPRVLFEGDSAMNHLIVSEDAPGVRALRFDWTGPRQTLVRVDAPLDLQLPYLRATAISLALVPEPKRILIVGLGGGAEAMFLHTLFPDAEIDGVDIDPQVIVVAEKYLGFKPNAKLHGFAADGRAFTEKSAGDYDLIYLDAFGGFDVPAHLITLEFIKRVRSKLAPGGYAVGNVWKLDHNPHFYDVLRTYRAAFGEVCVIDVPDAVNTVFLSRADGKVPTPPVAEFASRAAELQKKWSLPFELEAYARSGCLSLTPDAGTVLADP
jgi:spermidine synthase